MYAGRRITKPITHDLIIEYGRYPTRAGDIRWLWDITNNALYNVYPHSLT